MIKTTLVIMAAGIGSRYGGGIKQLAKVGPSGEIIMDYSIHDALEAGFDKTVFIIRKDIEDDFREIIGKRIEKITDVDYAFQDINDLPEGYKVPSGRSKPWGTGQAILSIRGKVDTPFAAINADDYYGVHCFKHIHDYMTGSRDISSSKLDICMAGFRLGNTLSDNGTVTRGVCKVKNGILESVTETFDISEKAGKIAGRDASGNEVTLSADAPVSMNMWGLPPAILDELEAGFPVFLDSVKEGDLKAEYLLPAVIDNLIKEGRAEVKVLPTEDKWFGVTYIEDKAYVEKALRDLVSKGIYKEKLFGQQEY
ncbi:MAG: nucleotidyltransferase family protein [Candidatus Avilachnospira sp.]|jgi:hypothetical protein